MKRLNLFSAALWLLLDVTAYAASNVAVLARVKGDVKLLTHPSKEGKVLGPAPHAIYANTTYSEVKAKRGAKIKNGFVIRTGPKGKARLIFKNGDTQTIASNTAYRISWEEGKPPLMELFHGKLRSMFKNGGPRKGSSVQTRSTVMGVRGTDFYVKSGVSTEVSVLRGKVALKKKKKGAKPVELKKGFSAKVSNKVKKKEPAPLAPSKTTVSKKNTAPTPKVQEEVEIKVVETTKVALLDIQKESVVPKVIAIPGEGVPVMMAKTPEDKKVEEELAALEQQAIENTMEDIKETDPELYKKVKQDSKETKKFDIDNISSRAVGEAFKKAPIDTTSNKEQKPVDKELDGLGDDAYKKYFQNY